MSSMMADHAADVLPVRRSRSLAAEREFRRRLDALGAVLLEPEWLGARVKHHIRCPAGHDCYQLPNRIQQGTGLCRACAGRDPASSELAFRAAVAELGGLCLFTEWRGANTPHHVLCAAGHHCYPMWGSIQQGQGMCRGCARRDPVTTEAAFRACVEAAGGVPLWERYGGNKSRLHVRCVRGHDCYPRPNDVLNGSGICQTCAGQEWDVFYVVTSETALKFGISSGTGRPRLRRHAARGFVTVERLVTGLAGTLARDTENAVCAALADAGERPLAGREYFDVSCLALVLDVADPWLSSAA